MSLEMIEVVKDYLDKRTLTQGKFASKAGIHKRTINRLFEGKPIHAESALKMLQVVHGNDFLKIYRILREMYPDDEGIAKALKNYESSEHSYPIDQNMKQFFGRSTITKDLGILLTYEDGISQALILKKFGEAGLELVEQLKEDGIVIELESGNLRFENNKLVFDPETARSLTVHSAHRFDLATWGSPGSMLSQIVGFTSEKGLERMKGYVQDALGSCLAAKKANPGNIPFILTGLMTKVSEDLKEIDKPRDDKSSTKSKKTPREDMI